MWNNNTVEINMFDRVKFLEWDEIPNQTNKQCQFSLTD